MIEVLKAELNARRPVLASGGSHYYLLDGYDSLDRFHCNFGWGGLHDGYYPLNEVVNSAGTWSPNVFVIGIRPLEGVLETSEDSIRLLPGTTSTNVEFSATLPWTISSPDPWISLKRSSGDSGYFNQRDILTATVNNGPARIGRVFVQTAQDTDTVVIHQDASPLMFEKDSLWFGSMGASQDVAFSCYSWVTWNAESSDPWIVVTPSTSKGSGRLTISATPTSDGRGREGFVVLSGSPNSDTIRVVQSGGSVGLQQRTSTRGIVRHAIRQGEMEISLDPEDLPATVQIFSTDGSVIWERRLESRSTILPLREHRSGTVVVRVEGRNQLVDQWMMAVP